MRCLQVFSGRFQNTMERMISVAYYTIIRFFLVFPLESSFGNFAFGLFQLENREFVFAMDNAVAD